MERKQPFINRKATGKRISELLNQKSKTLEDLAAELHSTTRTVARYLSGEVIPDPQRMFIIARFLDVKIDDMIVTNPKALHS